MVMWIKRGEKRSQEGDVLNSNSRVIQSGEYGVADSLAGRVRMNKKVVDETAIQTPTVAGEEVKVVDESDPDQTVDGQISQP